MIPDLLIESYRFANEHRPAIAGADVFLAGTALTTFNVLASLKTRRELKVARVLELKARLEVKDLVRKGRRSQLEMDSLQATKEKTLFEVRALKQKEREEAERRLAAIGKTLVEKAAAESRADTKSVSRSRVVKAVLYFFLPASILSGAVYWQRKNRVPPGAGQTPSVTLTPGSAKTRPGTSRAPGPNFNAEVVNDFLHRRGFTRGLVRVHKLGANGSQDWATVGPLGLVSDNAVCS